MFTTDQFWKLPNRAKETIIDQTFDQKNSNSIKPHSINSILSANRDIAIGARMTSKPLQFKQYDQNLQYLGTMSHYTGHQIADIFVNSVNQYGATYYPITGDWTKSPQKHLIIFVKANGRYEPYAKFSIDEILRCSTISQNQASSLTDPTPVMNCTFKCLLKISAVSTTFMQNISFLGLTSGVDIYDRAFKGGSPIILIL